MKKNEIQQLLDLVCENLELSFPYEYKLIGKGYSGSIWKISDKYCIKTTKKQDLINDYNIKSKYICTPIKEYSAKNYNAYLLNYYNGGNLQNLIKCETVLDEREACFIMHDIIKGLSVLHNRGYLHRDFQPGNIMLNTENKQSRAIIIDLDDIMPKEICIDPCFKYNGYHAPEIVIDGTRYSEKSEMFSVGIMMWELLFGKCPFAGYSFFGKIVENSWDDFWKEQTKYEKRTQTAIKRVFGDLEFPNKISLECAQLLMALINPDEKKRITASEALNFSFFKNIVIEDE